MKVAIVIASKGFKDEEYFRIKERIEMADHEIETVSTRDGFAQGIDGGQAKIDKTIDELIISRYAGLIFIGGPGALKQLDNKESHNLIQRSSRESDFIVGAICIAPIILAHAHCFEGYKMTVWSDPLQKWPIKELEDAKIIYSPDSVICDRRVITASGPTVAILFAERVILSLDKLNK